MSRTSEYWAGVRKRRLDTPKGTTKANGHVKDPDIVVSGDVWTQILHENELLRAKKRREASRANSKSLLEGKKLRYEALSTYFTHVDEVDIKYYWAMGAAPLFPLWRIKWKLKEGPAIAMVVFAYFRYVTHEDLRYFGKMNMFPGRKPRAYYIRSLIYKGYVQKCRVPSSKGTKQRTIFVLTPLGGDAIADYGFMLDQTIEYLYKGKQRDEKTTVKLVK